MASSKYHRAGRKQKGDTSNLLGDPPALPGWQPEFYSSGSQQVVGLVVSNGPLTPTPLPLFPLPWGEVKKG